MAGMGLERPLQRDDGGEWKQGRTRRKPEIFQVLDAADRFQMIFLSCVMTR
jgi:hypothetical protein